MKGIQKIKFLLLAFLSIFNIKSLALQKNEIPKNNAKVSMFSKESLSKIKKFSILGGIGTIIIAGIVITTVCALKVNNKKSEDNNTTKANGIEILLENFKEYIDNDTWNKFKNELKNILTAIANRECIYNDCFKEYSKPIFKLLKGEESLEDCKVRKDHPLIKLGLDFKVSKWYNLNIENDGFQLCIDGKILFQN